MSALFFLPDRSHAPTSSTALVPDSKILWDLTVTAKSLGLVDVAIEVRGQRVGLSGTATNAQARAEFLEAVRRATGVRSVSGDIAVRP